MKRIVTLICSICIALPVISQDEVNAFTGHYVNREHGIHLHLDLDRQSLEVPGFSFLGKMGGYINGKIYGVWLLTSHQQNGKKARLRFSNDQGSDSQTIELEIANDSTLYYKTLEGNVIRKTQGRKLVKTPNELHFVRVRE